LQVKEIRINYTNCFKDAPTDGFSAIPSENVYQAFGSNNVNTGAQWHRQTVNVTHDGPQTYESTQCSIQFNVPESMGPPVLFYYHLTNFYQNHRRYVASFFDRQLKGEAVSASGVNGSACAPLVADPETGLPLYPCGLIANSMFNDTFSSPFLLGSNAAQPVYQMFNNTNIAWSSDAGLYGKTTYNLSEIMPPPNWRRRYPNGYTAANPPKHLDEWQHFQVWMRTAGLPVFSKLYQRNDDKAMEAGTYQVDIIHS
jgi:hypothetical protein